MAFLQPYMLWGMLAVAVPVAIHFWYQKRGKTIEWAAMRWLGEQTSLQHRGIRLNEVWLMLLRCLLVILLALVLSKPVTHWFENVSKPEVIHLVQADRLVTETYRFELERALRQGEPVYWLGHTPEKVGDLGRSGGINTDLKYLQENINALASGHAKDFRLYFRNDGRLKARVYVPGEFKLFPAADSSYRKPIDILKSKPVYKNTIKVLLDYHDVQQAQTVRAALVALQEVVGFPFEIALEKGTSNHYDWIFTDQLPGHTQPGTTYVVSGNAPQWNLPAQVVQLRDTLRIANSDLVESGRLPEWLGDLLMEHMGLKTEFPPMSNSQLNALFEKVPASRAQEEAVLRPWLLLVFIILMAVERWVALSKTGRNNG